MKKIVSLSLILAFGAQTFSQGINILDFYINQSHIAATKCVNRDRPMLHCNGQCQLAKKIKQQEQKEQQNSELKLTHKNEVVSSRSFFSFTSFLLPVFHQSYSAGSGCRTTDRSFAVFHPPAD